MTHKPSDGYFIGDVPTLHHTNNDKLYWAPRLLNGKPQNNGCPVYSDGTIWKVIFHSG